MKFPLLALFLILSPQPSRAADFSDPDWPCIQRKVGTLSPALMWPHPVTEAPLEPAASDLVEALSLRRVGLDEAEAMTRAFVAATPEVDLQVLGAIFSGVLDRLDRDRRRLIDGIARYAHSQTALAAHINAARTQVDALMAASEPDYDQIDLLEERIDWDERIYQDRARSLTYVCETPVLLEKRAFAIAQILLKSASR